jgi:histidyl-tRNA synthetase
MFRYDRPQHGRYRQHFQFGMESFGDGNPIVDAELIYLAVLFCKQNGVAAMVKINSIGCASCRAAYIAKLLEYYKSKRTHLCEDCKRRMVKNPLRLLDCKVSSCAPFKLEAPVFLDNLDEECKKHITRVLEILDDLQVPYDIDNNLVRGFDYYNRTVFELFSSEGETPVALGGGGRYDGLVEQLGGRPLTPACGFGLGIDRLAMHMRERGVPVLRPDAPMVFLAQLGDPARKKAFVLFEELRAGGVAVSANFSKSAIKAQLEIANRLGVKYTLILGQQEVVDGTVLVRDMESGMQETVDIGKVVYDVKKKLGMVA